MKIRDSIALGTVAGLLGNIPSLILNFISVQLGFSKTYSFQISGGIYLFRRFTMEPGGILLGLLVWIFTSAFLGVAIVYLLKLTGRDYWWLKGILVSNFLMFVGMYGVIYSLGGSRVVPWDIPTNLSVLMENTLFGITAAYLAIRLDGTQTERN
jgi:hypothetical protein